MNSLNSYGYNDGDNSLLSLKMKQQAIDNAQDKKIDNLSKQSGGGGNQALEVIIDHQNIGIHQNLTKEEAIQYLNISESDFDKLMSGQYNMIVFSVNVVEGDLSGKYRATIPVINTNAEINGVLVSQVLHAECKDMTDNLVGLLCQNNQDTYMVKLSLTIE